MSDRSTIERLPDTGPGRPTGRSAARGPAKPRHQPPRLSGHNRYSLFVGVLKVLLPALAAGLILLVFAWPQLRPLSDRFRIGVTDLSLEQADNLTMLNARYQGRDDKNQLFHVTADMATQASGEDQLLNLELPKADILLDDGTWLALTASSGRYQRDANTLDLIGQVNVFHDKGFELRTESAHVDLDAGKATGSDPVAGQGPFGLLESEGFIVVDRGERIFFTGKSRIVLFSDAKEAL